MKSASVFLFFVLAGFACFLAFLLWIEPNCRHSPGEFQIDSQNWTKDNSETSYQEQYPSAQTHYSATNFFPIINPALAEAGSYEADNNPNSAYWNPTGWWQKFFCEAKVTDVALAFFTYCLIVVGGFQARYLYNTVAATKEAADAAALNAQAVINSERAHIFIDIDVENITREIPHANLVTKPEFEDHMITALRLSYTLKNYGKTPAIIRDIKHSTFVARNLLGVHEYESVVDLPAHILGAKETSSPISVIDLPRLTVREARSIRGAESTFWFRGIIVYDDTFGWRRTLKFIWHYGADSNGFRIFEYKEKEERRADDD
jgi:hypothetical protein